MRVKFRWGVKFYHFISRRWRLLPHITFIGKIKWLKEIFFHDKINLKTKLLSSHQSFIECGKLPISLKLSINYKVYDQYQSWSNFQDIAVAQTVIHDEYSRGLITVNDIGLLRLKRPINFTYSKCRFKFYWSENNFDMNSK